MTERDPENTDWRSGFGVSERRLADVAEALANYIEEGLHPESGLSSDTLRKFALTGYASSLSIFSDLSMRVLHDPGFQRNLCLAALGQGHLLKTINEAERAMEPFRYALLVAKELVELDPTNVIWAGDLERARAEIEESAQPHSAHQAS